MNYEANINFTGLPLYFESEAVYLMLHLFYTRVVMKALPICFQSLWMLRWVLVKVTRQHQTLSHEPAFFKADVLI